MGNADLEAKLAALKKAEADLAVVKAQIKAEREHIEKVYEKIQAASPDPDVDPEIRIELDRLIAQAQGLKSLIATEKLAIADAAKPPTDIFQGKPLGEPVFDEPAPAKPSTDIFQGMPLGEPVFDEPAPGPEASIDPKPSQAQPTSPPRLTGESGLGYEFEVAAAPDTRKRVAVVAAFVIVALLGVGAVVARLGSGPSPTPTAPAVAVATSTDSPIPTVSRAPTPLTTVAPTATATTPTLPPLPAGPISYSSDCNGACFMTVDPVSCDRTFHFVLSLLKESATAFDGKTAIISTVGPGLQPTYEVPVVAGKVILDAVAKGSDYGGNPNAGCGVNAHWTGLLTSVDGKPTTTPNAPT